MWHARSAPRLNLPTRVISKIPERVSKTRNRSKYWTVCARAEPIDNNQKVGYLPLSRILLLAHWTSDVVAGLALGAMLERGLRFVTGYGRSRRERPPHASSAGPHARCFADARRAVRVAHAIT